SYESGVLEDPDCLAPEGLCEMTVDPEKAPDKPQLITINFDKGLPVSVVLEGKPKIEGDLEVFSAVNSAAAAHGVGRLDIVENRFLGLKSRGVYETPGLTVLITAHRDLESVCLDKEVRRVKAMLSNVLSEQIYNGLWFSPEAEYTRQCIVASQTCVTGSVVLKLFKGSAAVVQRRGAPGCSLYNSRLVSMDEHTGFDPTDASGFINIHALRLREYRSNRAA
ncbi:Argininosuccinate synthase, partial [Trinorchestia longiramus]